MRTQKKTILMNHGYLLLTVLLCVCFVVVTAFGDSYKTLSKGDKGEAVVELKQRMYELGYIASKKFSDSYNQNMVKCVKQLQEVNGLEQTGVATAELQEYIYSDKCHQYENVDDLITNFDSLTMPGISLPKPNEELTEDDFLVKPGAQFVYANEDEGLWNYISNTLIVRISRYQDAQKPLTWFETEIFTRDGQAFESWLSQRNKKNYAWVHGVSLARENHVVLAVNDDYFGTRIRKGSTVGIIIRNGEIISDRTFSADKGAFPNLETLAIYKDGSMQTNESDAYTAQEYLDKGATQVLAFGPALVTDGKPGKHITDHFYYFSEPRTAIGMVAPGHYIILSVEGRVDRSVGVHLPWLANRMIALGVKEAINLDGGGTMMLIFMGKTLNQSKAKDRSGDNTRSMTGIFGIGTSLKVE